MHGIINVIKPSGFTSQKVVSIIKRKLNVQKAGHLGTLDPSGTGVLPVCINKGTKLFDYFLNKDKVYRAVFVFGKSTDTLDSDGVVINESNNIPTKQQIQTVLPLFKGKQNQIPPNYSRKCVNGVRAYELARKNIDFELKPKQIEIYNIQLIEQLSDKAFLFEIHCSSGTYIRSIVRDLSKKLNTYGYMCAIIRIKSGYFNIEQAVKLEDVTEKDIISCEQLLHDVEKIELNNSYYDKLINGAIIHLNFEDKDIVRVYCKNEFFGLANITKGILKIKTNLR